MLARGMRRSAWCRHDDGGRPPMDYHHPRRPGGRTRFSGAALALVAVAAVVVAASGAGVRAAVRVAAEATPTATPGPTPTPLSTTPVTYVVIGASDAFGVG